MIELAYLHLVSMLTQISVTGDDDRPPYLHTAAAMHAWSMVEAANRLRVLVDNMPGLQKSTPEYQVFIRRLRQFKDLRDPIQHLDTELKRRAVDDGPTYVWGALAWALLDDDLEGASTFMLIPGSLQTGQTPHFVNPAGQEFVAQLDHVELAAYDSRVSLSRLIDTISVWTERIEEQLRPQFDGHDHSGSDFFFAMKIKFTDAPEDSAEAS